MLLKNEKNEKIQKDIVKRFLLYLLAVVFIGIVVHSGYEWKEVSNSKSSVEKTSETVVDKVVSKETQKVVNGKLETTGKEIQTTESPKKPKELKGFWDRFWNLLEQKTLSGVFVRHITAIVIVLFIYAGLNMTVLRNGSYEINLGFFNLKSSQNGNSEIKQKLESQRTKLDILRYWVTLGNQEKFSATVQKSGNPNVEKGLSDYLSTMFREVQETYDEMFDIHFDVEVLTPNQSKKLPKIVKKSVIVLNNRDNGIAIGKEEDLPFHKNYLIYKVESDNENGIIEYIISLSSYRYAFDEDDEMLIAALGSTATTVYQAYTSYKRLTNNKEKIRELENKIEELENK